MHEPDKHESTDGSAHRHESLGLDTARGVAVAAMGLGVARIGVGRRGHWIVAAPVRAAREDGAGVLPARLVRGRARLSARGPVVSGRTVGELVADVNDAIDARFEQEPDALTAALWRYFDRIEEARSMTFAQAWAKMRAKGYQYGEDALEQVRMGWDLAQDALDSERARAEGGAEEQRGGCADGSPLRRFVVRRDDDGCMVLRFEFCCREHSPAPWIETTHTHAGAAKMADDILSIARPTSADAGPTLAEGIKALRAHAPHEEVGNAKRWAEWLEQWAEARRAK